MKRSIPYNPDQCIFDFESLDNQPVDPPCDTFAKPQEMPRVKQCCACREVFPATKQFFGVHNQTKDGWYPRCKTCRKTEHAPYKRDNIQDGKKQCAKCQQWFPANSTFFHKNNQKKDGWHPWCKKCKNAQDRDYDAANKEKVKANRKERYPRYREKISAYDKIYREAHREEINAYGRSYREAHREEIDEYKRQYMKSEQGRAVYRASRHKRKAIKKATPGTLTAQQIQTKLTAQKHKCYYCQIKFEKKDGNYIFHLEHTVPLSRIEEGPRHDVNFVVLSCPSCNLRKHDKLPHEFSEGGRLL